MSGARAGGTGEILILGIGHSFRRDDAVGPLVAERFRGRAGVEVLVHHGEGTDMMERWQGFDKVVAVDATCPAGAPGRVRSWDAAAGPLPAGLLPKGSHVFGLAEGIEMARLLGRLPPAFLVIGVEGLDFSSGQELTPAVAAALGEAVAAVEAAL